MKDETIQEVFCADIAQTRFPRISLNHLKLLIEALEETEEMTELRELAWQYEELQK